MRYESPEQLMRLAIEKARIGIAAGQTPFGCAIAKAGEVVAVAHNRVWLATDITAHAEMNAIREACAHVQNIHLDGAIVATTCEPCPMCMAALHWARVDTVYYGATIADAEQAGFNELACSATQLCEIGGSRVQVVPGVLAEECRRLFADWKRSAEAREY